MRPDPSVVLVDGPWQHREVSANGFRFHVAEAGQGPLVLLLHGFPSFWWTFSRQLPVLAEAGFRAVAVDLRGYGASDKPPRGYDAFTLVADIVGMIKALGEDTAIVVGHDWGGYLGWCVATWYPEMVSRLVVLSAPHPLAARRALLVHREQLAASGLLFRFQLPWSPERLLVKDNAAFVHRMLSEWSRTPGYPDPETDRRHREAMLIPGVAHSSMEYYRWSVRSVPRSDGRRFYRAMRRPAATPTLQLHGGLDPRVLPATAAASGRYARGPYRWQLLDGVGHFPQEEAPDLVNRAILDWIAPS